MPRPAKRSTPAGAASEPGPEPAPPGPVPPTPAAAAALGSLSDLPVAGLTRRRIALLIGALVAAWVIVLFARQVGDATEASARAEVLRTQNEQLAAGVSALEGELELIQRQAYIEQQAREYRLGGAREIPFVLADGAPPLAADAPGTAATRLGARPSRPTPLDSWLNLLFGPAGDPASAMSRPAPSEPPTPEPSS